MHVLGLLQARPQAGSPLITYLFMGALVLMFWLLVLRPANKQRREQDAMRSALKAGDRVRMSGGLYGTVGRVKDDRVFVKVAPGVELEFARAAVAALIIQKDE